MCESASYIISGPQDDYDVPNASVGKIIFDCLTKKAPDDVISIDAVSGDVLTCSTLLQNSIKLTAVFEKLGIEKDDTIAIIRENSVNYCEPLLAAFYMGVVVNPLNPEYKEGELKHALLISKPKLILCSDKALHVVLQVKEELKFVQTVLLVGSKYGTYANVKSLESLVEATSVDTQSFKPVELDPLNQGALILLSSGTTGLPKGVLLTHRNLREAIGYFSHPNYGNVTSQDVTVAVLPFFHMFGLSIQLLTMAICLKSVVIDAFKPDLFLKSIQSYKATKLFVVPPILLLLAKSHLVDNYDLSSIKDIVVGGASVGKELQSEATKRLGTVTIRQAYGLTETCGPCAFLKTCSKKMGTVGTLVPAAIAKLCNSTTQQTVGPLEVGEICFKGPMLMKGYVGNWSATQKCIDEEGFFHTGDLGFYDNQGFLYIADRISELIKNKGFQVSPVELEAVILTHTSVRECGVIGIPDERAGEIPLAFVVPENGACITEQDIVDFVAEKISAQKHLYGGVRFVSEIPKTPSGKIMRRKLIEIFKSTH